MNLQSSVVEMSYGSFGFYTNVTAYTTYDKLSVVYFFELWDLTNLGEFDVGADIRTLALG